MAERNNDDDDDAECRKRLGGFLRAMGYECPIKDRNTLRAWAECGLNKAKNRELITRQDFSSSKNPAADEINKVEPTDKSITTSTVYSLNSRLTKDPSRFDDNNENTTTQQQAPEIPPKVKRFIHKIQGSDQTVELVYENHLSPGDVNPSRCRLMMLSKHVHRLDILEQMKEKGAVRLYVLSRQHHYYDLFLTQWEAFGSKNYVLRSGWGKVVEENELEENMVVQLWSFRVGDIRCLLLVCVDGGDDCVSSEEGDACEAIPKTVETPSKRESDGVESSKSRKGKEKVHDF